MCLEGNSVLLWERRSDIYIAVALSHVIHIPASLMESYSTFIPPQLDYPS